jgi:hypothetical protein
VSWMSPPSNQFNSWQCRKSFAVSVIGLFEEPLTKGFRGVLYAARQRQSSLSSD